MLEDVPLDTDIRDRAGFDYGVAELNEYLPRFAGRHRRMGISSTYVLVDTDQPILVLSYYSLSAARRRYITLHYRKSASAAHR